MEIIVKILILAPLVSFPTITKIDIEHLKFKYEFYSFLIDIETLEIYGVVQKEEDLLEIVKMGTLVFLKNNKLEIELM